MSVAEAERQVLRFAAAHELVETRQVGSLLGVEAAEADRRLDGLATDRLLMSERNGVNAPSYFRITSAGLRRIGGQLPPPGLAPRVLHALGVGWLWLTASSGGLGPVDRVLSEREMRAEDRGGSPEGPFDVRPVEFGGQGGAHYPDLILLTGAGRVAVELLFGAPQPDELAAMLRAYAADARMAGVLVLVADPRVGRLVQSVVAGLELTAFARVQMARPG